MRLIVLKVDRGGEEVGLIGIGTDTKHNKHDDIFVRVLRRKYRSELRPRMRPGLVALDQLVVKDARGGLVERDKDAGLKREEGEG